MHPLTNSKQRTDILLIKDNEIYNLSIMNEIKIYYELYESGHYCLPFPFPLLLPPPPLFPLFPPNAFLVQS